MLPLCLIKMTPDFDSIDFDKPVSILGIGNKDSLEGIFANPKSIGKYLIESYQDCPNNIIMFFRELSTHGQTNFSMIESGNALFITYNFEDCLDLFMQSYKQTGDAEFDHLAQKVIELAILNKGILRILLVINQTGVE